MANFVGKTLLGRYFLRKHVGSGGMADVYLAWDKIRSVQLAVKVLRRDLSTNPRFFEMIAKEAKLLQELEHPNIVRFYEFERDGDVDFIVMDWVSGINLHQAISKYNEPFSLEDMSHILRPICSALNYAHQKKVFHCDVKPANILLHKNQQVLLTDFGVARYIAQKAGGGTPPYMAPEQFFGKSVDTRTDVYAMGIVLFEMISGGQVPYQGDTPNSRGSTKREKIAWEHINLPLPSPQEVNSKISNAVSNVIVTALNKEPNQRYPSTMALLAAFEHARITKGDIDPVTQSIRQTSYFHEPKMTPPPMPKRKSVSKRSPKQKGPRLFVCSGDYAGQKISISFKGLSIGRSSNCHLRLKESSVSRSHSRISRTPRGVFIRDENSSLGTYINGERIYEPLQLCHGDIIQIGYHQIFEFRAK